MPWFEDFAPCSYFGPDLAPALRTIGWLERGRSFRTGLASPDVYDKLVELCKEPWQPCAFLGLHGCDLCHYRPGAYGVNNLFIPGTGYLFVCPELIVHYMNAHAYSPPSEFCDAVLACPQMKSMDYRKSILENGGRPVVKWAKYT